MRRAARGAGDPQHPRSIPAAGAGNGRCPLRPPHPRGRPRFLPKPPWVFFFLGWGNRDGYPGCAPPNFGLGSPPPAPSVDAFSSPRGPLLRLPCRQGRARFPLQRKHAGVWAGRPAAPPTPHRSRRRGDARPGGLLAAELRAGGARPSPHPWGRGCGAQPAVGRTHGCPGSGHPRWVRDQAVGAGALGGCGCTGLGYTPV